MYRIAGASARLEAGTVFQHDKWEGLRLITLVLLRGPPSLLLYRFNLLFISTDIRPTTSTSNASSSPTCDPSNSRIETSVEAQRIEGLELNGRKTKVALVAAGLVERTLLVLALLHRHPSCSCPGLTLIESSVK